MTVAGLTVENQGIGSAQNVDKSFTSDSAPSSGLLGLGFDTSNTQRPEQKTWFGNIKDSLDAKLFTANLNHKAAGTYNFGYIDEKEHSGPIAYARVIKDYGYWGFHVGGFGVGGAPNQDSFTGIADTGTTLLILPSRVANAYWDQVSGSFYNPLFGAQVYPCNTRLPDFTFKVGDSIITVPGQDIAYGNVGRFGLLCFGGIQSSDRFTIFGDIAFKSNLVVFDDGNSRVGWARK